MIFTELEWRALVLLLRRGDCWCEMAIGNPMYKEHTKSCIKAQEMVDNSEPARCPDCGFETTDADAMFSHCCQ